MVGGVGEPLLIKGFVGVGKVYGQVFDRRGVCSLKISSVTPSGLGSRAPAECRMDAPVFAALPVGGKTAHGENAGWCGNGLVFPACAPERGSMTRRSTTILQAENQNRSKTSPVSGGGFVIFENGQSRDREPGYVSSLRLCASVANY